MLVVAFGVAGTVLHVADEDVGPVDEIERSVGGKLKIHGTEILIAAVTFEEVVTEIYFEESRFRVVLHTMLFGSKEANGVAEDDIALDFIGEVAG